MKKHIERIMMKYWLETKGDFPRTSKLSAEELSEMIAYMMKSVEFRQEIRKDIDDLLNEQDDEI